MVGIVQVMVFPHFQHTGGWCCELESVHVRSDWRSRGVGAALLDAAEALLDARVATACSSRAETCALDAHRFYEANGYVAMSQGFKKLL